MQCYVCEIKRKFKDKKGIPIGYKRISSYRCKECDKEHEAFKKSPLLFLLEKTMPKFLGACADYYRRDICGKK